MTRPSTVNRAPRVVTRPDSWEVQLARVAAAFELSTAEVREDWSLVHFEANTSEDLLEQLRLRHAWDASMAPYYVEWLKRAQRADKPRDERP